VTTRWAVPWDGRQTAILRAFDELVERVRLQIPELVARNGTSTQCREADSCGSQLRTSGTTRRCACAEHDSRSSGAPSRSTAI
jgi:hypothetical protein